MTEAECKHTVGVEWGYEESGFTGCFLDKNDLERIRKTRAEENSYGDPNYTTFKYCPICGAKLTTKDK